MEAGQPLIRDPLHHPIEVVQKNARRLAEQQQLQQQALTFGRGFAMRTALDRHRIAGIERRGVMRSSNVLSDSYDDRLTQISFSDFLGLPKNNPNVQPTSRQLLNEELWGTDLVMKRMAQ